MALQTIYPGADARTQWFADAYPGDIMALTAPVFVIHTTEGGSWPSYQGGATAPQFTIWPGHGVRQHFPVNMSARALVGAATAGCATNTAGAIQVELVGTCALGGPGIYWPNATDEQLQPVADLARWLHEQWGLELASNVTWAPYPQSYGRNASQRLSMADWLAYAGILGHQHVYGNDHGDPGLFPAERLLSLASSTGLPGAPITAPAPVPTGDGFDMATLDDLRQAVRDVLNEQTVGAVKWSAPHVWDYTRRAVNGNAAQLAGLEAAVKALGDKAGIDVQAVYDAAAKGASDGVQAEISGADVQVNLTTGGAA